MQRIVMEPFSKFGDTLAIEFRNIKSLDAMSGALQFKSCYDVYNNTTVQSYFFDAVNSTLCLRLVATSLAFASYAPDGAWGYQGYVVLQVTPGMELSTTTVGLTSAGSTTGSSNPYALSSDCQCLAARYDYWNRYPDIYNYPMDPVYHYQHSGGLEGRTWDCSKCSSNPHFISESFCNCTAAQATYHTHYPTVTSDAFTYYLSVYQATGAAWNCELCTPPVTPTTSTSSTTAVASSTTGKAPSTTGKGNTHASSSDEQGSNAINLIPIAWISIIMILFTIM